VTRRRCSALVGIAIAFLPWLLSVSAQGGSWVPTDEEIERYRSSWNPLTHGPILVTIADTLPKGQFYIRPFI
jgi:hypothetical protein